MQAISAIATAQGAAGVAIIRISGEGALSIAKKMFSKKGEFTPNVLYPGTIDCGSFSDFGMCVFFQSPKSFTGEDVVEFHCHGGVEIARGVLKRTVELGCRLAERGEFTKRAFLNGKLSLSAAEGMADMINAESLAQVRAGYLLYGDKLTNEGRRLQDILKECLAGVDADIDYPEEDLSTDTRQQVKEKVQEVLTSLEGLLRQYRAGRKVKSGVNVAIVGKPNAGKSSLLNALLGYERAIVSSEEGTTRDLVEGCKEIGGVLFRFTDTAGLRETQNEIEKEGVRRAENALKAADLVLLLSEDDGFRIAVPEGVEVIRVHSKCDLKRGDGLNISSLTGEGLEQLQSQIFEKGFGAQTDGVFLMEERHFETVKEAYECAQNALNAIENGLEAELYAEDLKDAWDALGTLSGETATEDVIEEIFSKFCVGK